VGGKGSKPAKRKRKKDIRFLRERGRSGKLVKNPSLNRSGQMMEDLPDQKDGILLHGLLGKGERRRPCDLNRKRGGKKHFHKGKRELRQTVPHLWSSEDNEGVFTEKKNRSWISKKEEGSGD